MSGIIGGPRQYDGPGLGSGPWKCPACAVPNDGPIDAGCVSCGSGSARPFKHVGPPPEIARPAGIPEDLHLVDGSWVSRASDSPPDPSDLDRVARDWCRAHADAATEDAFVAGCYYMRNLMMARTMAAPPVTTDLAELAPEGKPRRTIIAALELFKDQVLREAADEIANGEWCSIEETEEIISQLKREEGSL